MITFNLGPIIFIIWAVQHIMGPKINIKVWHLDKKE